jgi:hypothetical protein
MIRFVGGVTGGGKSLYAFTHILVPELLQGTRRVVTNLPVRVDALQAYLDEHASAPVHVLDRIRILDDSQMYQFFRYRGSDASPVDLPVNLEGLPVFPAEGDGGVLYILDELHIFFNAREWKKTGAGAIFYLSQHRKLSDDVICITQSIKNVDSQFRSLGATFSYVSNHRTATFRGFRRGSGFKVHTYLSPAVSANDVPVEITSFPLDRKLADCYDTAAGVGMGSGKKADLGAKAKGLPLSVLYWAIPLGALVFIGGGLWASQVVRGKLADIGQRKLVEPPPASPVAAPASVVPAAPPPASPVAAAAPASPADRYVGGIIQRGREFRVRDSAGHLVPQSEIARVGRDGVLLRSGEWLRPLPVGVDRRAEREAAAARAREVAVAAAAVPPAPPPAPPVAAAGKPPPQVESELGIPSTLENRRMRANSNRR